MPGLPESEKLLFWSCYLCQDLHYAIVHLSVSIIKPFPVPAKNKTKDKCHAPNLNLHMPEIIYNPIGIVHSPFKNPEGTPIQSVSAKEAEAVIEIYPGYVEGLKDLDGFSHLYILFHLHLVTRMPLTVIPFLDNIPHGVFATRSPARPNPIGLSVVLLDRIVDNKLYVRQIDILDGSPVLDIKPYISQFDVFETSKNGWFDNRKRDMDIQKDDGRFTMPL